mgnify:CR=1 FL=1
MGDFGMEATNEMGNTHAYADLTIQALPAPVYGTAAGAQAGLDCRPHHAFISVEGGDIRYRLDGSDVVEQFGVLVKDGGTIDWTDPLRDFSAFIDNMSFIATNGAESVLLNISWRT